MFDKFTCIGIVGDIAPAFPGYQQLPALLPHLLQDKYPATLLGSTTRSKQACWTCSNNYHIKSFFHTEVDKLYKNLCHKRTSKRMGSFFTFESS
jgi:hypothetical protein